MKKFFIYTIVLCLIWGCKEDAVFPDHVWYEVSVNEPVVDATGVSLSAQIVSTGSDDIIEKGFYVTRVFKKHPSWEEWEGTYYPVPDKVEEHYPLSMSENFSVRVEGEWDSGTTCFVQAYIKTGKRQFTTQPVTFVPIASVPAEVHSVTPDKGGTSGIFTFKGKNFSSYTNRNRVYLNDIRLTILEASATELKAEYCCIDTTGFKNIELYVGEQNILLRDAYYLEGPVIKSIVPVSPRPGELATIYCEDVKVTDNVSIYLSLHSFGGDNLEQYIQSRKDNEITFIFPDIIDNTDLHIVNLATGVRARPFRITVDNPWQEYADAPYESNSSFIYRNHLFLPGYSEINTYNLTTKTEEILPYPPGFFKQSTFVAIDNDFAYFHLYNPKNMLKGIYRRNMHTNEWTETANHLPPNKNPITHSPVIGDYAYTICHNWSSGTYHHMRYSLTTGQWETYSPDTSYKLLFTWQNELYGYDNQSIYKFNLSDLSAQPIVIFNFPQKTYSPHWDTLFVDGDILYINRNATVYAYNMKTMQLTSLGKPTDTTISYVFIFDNQLLVSSSGKLYKYTGN